MRLLRGYDEAALLGYEMPIKRALWERVKAFGVPRVIGSFWFLVCMLSAFFLLVLVSVLWAALAGGAWAVGQVFMMWMTARDPYWDDVLLAQLVRQYKNTYEAG